MIAFENCVKIPQLGNSLPEIVFLQTNKKNDCSIENLTFQIPTENAL